MQSHEIKQKYVSVARFIYRKTLKRTAFGRELAFKIAQRGWLLPRQVTPILDPQKPLIESEIQNERVPEFHCWTPYIRFVLSDTLSVRPHINVLIPSLKSQHMSGGPNTVLLLAAHLAARGERVRLISINAPVREEEHNALYAHMEKLFQRPIHREHVLCVDGLNPDGVRIGAHDLFVATAWWTAQIAKEAVRHTIEECFIYLIQDFEPLLHAASSLQSRALETYGLPHIPVINTRILLDHLAQQACGCYADKAFVERALSFEPAIDRSHYFPVSQTEKPKKKVLLFYARPTSALRNLFEVGLIALRNAVASGHITAEGWEVWAMGEKLQPILLGHGVTLNPLPWLRFEDYAERVRTADLLLSLMLAPHPSYPPLEMAASGKLVVTNSYGVKTKDRLQDVSPNMLVAEPHVDSVTSVLQNAVGRLNAGLPSCDPSGSMHFPGSWTESFSSLIPQLEQRIQGLRVSNRSHSKRVYKGYTEYPRDEYGAFKRKRLEQRRLEGPYFQLPGLLSFVSPTFNTDPRYLEELAASLFLQDGGTQFEWLILDNGSTDPKTIQCLQELAQHPCVRLERVENNLGIIGGMRYCLERATGRYIVPMDSDDIVEADCVHVLTKILRNENFPSLLYTDEDKLDGDRFIQPYFKPEWDPVLFWNSCYIAHLCAIDREKALSLALYSDPQAEGCHDWDSFGRFWLAGHTPHHIPEVLYSWRLHTQSTAGNINSKSFISNSHKAVLARFLNGVRALHLELVSSPLFGAHVDWWFKRKREQPQSLSTLVIGRKSRTLDTVFTLAPDSEIALLVPILDEVRSDLLHIIWEGVSPVDDEWMWDAMGLMELFPDTVIVGGTLHDHHYVLGGPMVFGFGQGCDCPDRGRSLTDPGFFAQMWKARSVSAVSSGHCVVSTRFLKQVIQGLISEKVPLAYMGPWLGALAKEHGKRVVFSPFMRALVLEVPEKQVKARCRAQFLSRFWSLLPDTKGYSSHFGLSRDSAYTSVGPVKRAHHLKQLEQQKLPYSEWIEMVQRHRHKKYPVSSDHPTLAVLTTIYEKTDFSLLNELAQSIQDQFLRPHQWIIVAHGPISAENLAYLRDQTCSHWNAILIEHEQPLGIMNAMHRALGAVLSEYIIPVDADDILTPDALQVMGHEIRRLNEPDMLYSDEDILLENRVTSPYFRASFDPLLSFHSSCIWHLCAIKYASAVHFGLYTDSGATWCHDWDTVTRIAQGRGRIEHVPEVLYHWRQHPVSTSNKPQGDFRSLDSVRHLLEKRIAQTPSPSLFFIDQWPLNTKELCIARRNRGLPPFIWMHDLAGQQLPKDAIIVVTSGDVMIDEQSTFNEVARLFELHPQVGAIGGRVTDKQGTVLDGCRLRNEQMCSLEGVTLAASGPYHLLFKVQTASRTGLRLAFFRLKAISEKQVPLELLRTSSELWVENVCGRLTEDGVWSIAYSPLVCGRTFS